MTWIMERLTAKVAGPIAAGLAILLAITLAVVIVTKDATLPEVRGQLATAGRDRDAAKADLVQCRANRLTLEEATRRQNAAVDAAKAEGDARAAGLAKAATEARTAATAAEARAKSILARPLPTGDQCKAADALILEMTR